MKRACLILLVLASTVWAQPLTLPRIGSVRDQAGRWRTLSGIAGTLLPGPVQWEGVRNGVAGQSRSLVRTADELIILEADGSVVARQAIPDGEVLLAIGNTGDAAIAWLCEPGELWVWHAGAAEWSPRSLLLAGTPIAWALNDSEVKVLLRRDGAMSLITLSLVESTVKTDEPLNDVGQLARVTEDGSVVWTDESGLHRRDPAGRVQDYTAPAHIVELSPAGGPWWQATDDTGALWALRLRGEAEWFEIPAGGAQ